MPPHAPTSPGPSAADREAELAALQTAFDEYIASSRELEDELDAELGKMQDKLAESSSANATLASQLEQVTPQLSSLEKALSDAKTDLSKERDLRRRAELDQDEAEGRAREAEGSLAKLKEECDDAIEQLAFREEELEEVKLELEVERERHAAEIDSVRASGVGGGGGEEEDDDARDDSRNGVEVDIDHPRSAYETFSPTSSYGVGSEDGPMSPTDDSEAKNQQQQQQRHLVPGLEMASGVSGSNEQEDDEGDDIMLDGIDESEYGVASPDRGNGHAAASPPRGGGADEDDADYVKQLEDELENVTEQLIEAETKVSELEGRLVDADGAKAGAEERLAETEERLRTAEAEASSEEERKKGEDGEVAQLTEEIRSLKEGSERQREELELTAEELTLVQEEMKAAEEDLRAANEAVTAVSAEHRVELSKLEEQVEAARSDARSARSEADALKDAVREASEESDALREEIDNLTKALDNAKADRDRTLEEMDDLKAAFDRAEKLSEEQAGPREEELRRELMETHAREVEELKEELEGLNEANEGLENMVDELKESQNAAVAKAASAAALAASAEGASAKSAAEGGGGRETELQADLDRAMADLRLRENEADLLRTDMEKRVAKTTEELEKAEEELEVARSQLSETKAKLAELEESKKVLKAPSPTKQPSKYRPAPVSFASGSSDSLSTLGEEEGKDEESGSAFCRSHARTRRRAPHSSRSRARSSSPTTVIRLECDLASRTAKARTLSDKVNSLTDQNKMSEVKVKSLENDIRTLQDKVSKGEPIAQQNGAVSSVALSQEFADVVDDDMDDDEMNVEEVIESRDPELMATELRSISKKSTVLREHNAGLLQKVLRLQGNIQVCCRVRPMTVSERDGGLRGVVEPLSETEVGCFDARTKAWKSYSFDKVWGSDSSQRGVFQDVEPLALSVVDGYNACIFAYGQTGSGKTYTMEGGGKQFGISHRTIKKIFSLLHYRAEQQVGAAEESENRDPATEANPPFVFNIEVGMLEIYNDEVYDLLATPPAAGGKKTIMDVRRGADGLVEVPGLVKEKVGSLEDVMDLLTRGNTNRATATTNMNEHSSRSHMILNVKVTCGTEGQPMSKGNLYLIDLAGSERVRKSEVEGEQLREAGHINKSLSALGNVMEALDRKAKHIPYRDSKLTYLLQDSLGGNSRTMMVVNVNPTDYSYDETTFALQFATRVRRINIGTAKKNVTSKNLEETVNKLSSELKLLAKAKERSEQQMHSLKRENKRVQDRLKSAAESRARSHDDTRTMTVLKKSHAEMTERWKKEKLLREGKTCELEALQQEMQRVQQETQRTARQVDKLTKQVSEKEDKLSDLQKQLRTAKEKASAANHRARTAQLVLPRSNSSVANSPRPSPSRPKRTSKPQTTAAKTMGAAKPSEADVANIREKVEKLLEEHDPDKVNKLDTLMERFKGRETFLLDKMVQRYEGGGDQNEGSASRPSTGGSTARVSAQQRSEIALQKHMERMKQRKEAQNGRASGGASSSLLQSRLNG